MNQKPYQLLRQFSDIMSDYLDEKEPVQSLYHRFPTLINFKDQILEKQTEWKDAASKRKLLTHVLTEQYQDLADKENSDHNIQLLNDSNTFTITTGHQLNLFTGPLYFLYKIISTINLCKKLKTAYPEYNFVPIYWMATEDHDFEEISYFNYSDKKIFYDRPASGAVGRLSCKGLDEVFNAFKMLLGNHDHAQEVLRLFKKGYLENKNLASATRATAHELFKKDGLVILDADDSRIKTLAIPYFKEELVAESSFKEVSKTLKNWPETYKVQVNPRACNLFYLTDNLRKRIIKKDGIYYIDETDITFSETQIQEELDKFPERFSPNVIMRPLYQEIILPNLCYIGGGGELAYWLELKGYFESQNVTFPMLLLRNSALLVTAKQLKKVDKLQLSIWDLFETDHELSTRLTHKLSEIKIDFSTQKKHLKQQFVALHKLALKTDPSFKNAVNAQERKQIKGLEHLEKRLLKAQKRKLKDHLKRALLLQQELFPNASLQERYANFSYFYQEFGPAVIDKIAANLDPLDMRFTVIEL